MNNISANLGVLTLAFVIASACDSARSAENRHPSPILATIAIVDVSPSMEGQRIKTAASELVEYLKLTPPSNAYPFVLITFAEKAYPPRAFVTKADAISAVESMTTGGKGTNIASGLRKAVDISRRFANSQSLLIHLYSDGEDSVQSAVDIEEARLSQMFASRATLGLSNQVALKRWGNANARLRVAFEKDTNVTVVDAGELKVLPVAFYPALRVVSVKRDDTDPLLLHVQLQSALTIRKPKSQKLVTSVAATCSAQSVTGATTITFEENQIADHEIAMKISPVQDKNGLASIAYHVAAETTKSPAGSIVLPVVANPKLEIDLEIPANPVKTSVTATVENVRAIRWDNALTGHAVIAATVTVSRVDSRSSDEPLLMEGLLKAVSNARLTKNPGTIRFTETGKQSFDVEFVVPQKGTAPGSFDAEMELTLESKSERLALSSPQSLHLDAGCQHPPDAESVPVKFAVKSVSPAQWALLPDLSVFDVLIEAEVDGHIPADTSLTIKSPSFVRNLKIEPSVLRSGTQQIRLTCWAKLPISPQPAELSFDIAVSNSLPTRLQLVVAKPIRVDVRSPKPLTLRQSGSDGIIELEVADNETSVNLNIIPSLEGLRNEAIAGSIRAKVSSDSCSLTPQTTPVFSPVDLSIPLPAHQSGFFEGEDIEVVVNLGPEKPAASIRPSKLRVRIHRRSPFVRIFTLLATYIGQFIAGLLMVWVARQFYDFEDIIFGVEEQNDDQ